MLKHQFPSPLATDFTRAKPSTLPPVPNATRLKASFVCEDFHAAGKHGFTNLTVLVVETRGGLHYVKFDQLEKSLLSHDGANPPPEG